MSFYFFYFCPHLCDKHIPKFPIIEEPHAHFNATKKSTGLMKLLTQATSIHSHISSSSYTSLAV